MKYLIKSPLKPIKLLYHAIKSESYIPVEFLLSSSKSSGSPIVASHYLLNH